MPLPTPLLWEGPAHPTPTPAQLCRTAWLCHAHCMQKGPPFSNFDPPLTKAGYSPAINRFRDNPFDLCVRRAYCLKNTKKANVIHFTVPSAITNKLPEICPTCSTVNVSKNILFTNLKKKKTLIFHSKMFYFIGYPFIFSG